MTKKSINRLDNKQIHAVLMASIRNFRNVNIGLSDLSIVCQPIQLPVQSPLMKKDDYFSFTKSHLFFQVVGD